MARFPPTRPGWYRNPDEPRSLRYWDGKAWSGRSRSQPAWAKRAEPFELEATNSDRSVEGPVHPHELREPVASAAWARDLFGPRRPRQSDAWHRPGGRPSRPMVPTGPQPTVRLGPARRPLVLLAALVMVAAAVVVSSVAVMSPYETRGNPGAARRGGTSDVRGPGEQRVRGGITGKPGRSDEQCRRAEHLGRGGPARPSRPTSSGHPGHGGSSGSRHGVAAGVEKLHS